MPLCKREFIEKITAWGSIKYTNVMIYTVLLQSDHQPLYDVYVRDSMKNFSQLHVYRTEPGEDPDEIEFKIKKWLKLYNDDVY